MNTRVLTMVVMGALAVLPACGGNGDGTESSAAASVPSTEMMSLALDSSDNGAALTSDPSITDAIAQELVAQLDDAIALLHPRIDALRDGGGESHERILGEDCNVWKATKDTVAYKLTVCERDRRADHHGFVLAGRPADSTSDDDYVRLVAGRGTALPRFDGERRGFGVVGYDFSAWNRLRGSGPVGQVALGYRISGRARTIEAAYRDFAGSAEGETHSARLHYHRVIGVGGRIVFGVGADVIAPGATEGSFVFGQDDLNERVRLAMAWARGIGARVSGAACGGTVGDTCITVSQCYTFNTEVTFDDVRNGNTAAFDEARCPRVDFAAGDVPSDDDVAVGGDTDEEIPGPDVAEPAESNDE